ncbi:MAG: hypothetical protein LBS73_02225, partial [Campylobacteraceae bacterium]|nr:hypothetical protein [Campylobacteraceae bacterium]
LLDFCDDKEDIKDIFYRLQALSCNDLLSAFRTLSQKETKEGSEKQLIERFNDFTALANDISSGNIDPQKINDLLGSLNLSMLSGAVIGGLGAVLTKEMGKKRDDE